MNPRTANFYQLLELERMTVADYVMKAMHRGKSLDSNVHGNFDSWKLLVREALVRARAEMIQGIAATLLGHIMASPRATLATAEMAHDAHEAATQLVARCEEEFLKKTADA